MQPRAHSADEIGRGPGIGAPGPTGIFRIDGFLGHAWFVRGDGTRPVVGRRQTLPALRRAELVLSGKGRAVARRPTRIPADSIVGIGANSSPLRSAPIRKVKASVANDNQRRVPPKLRTFLREMFFLVLFGATLAGTYYLGRMHAFHNVISVPDTPAKGHRIV